MRSLSVKPILCIVSVMSLLLLGICPAASAQEFIRLATTTSTDNTGLLAALLPPFEAKYKTKVAVIAVGTGKALKLAENGDMDVVLVHAPEAEDEFMKKGFGVNRRDVMYNDFVLVGPPDDPAKAKTSVNAAEAFRRIAEAGASFVSRGDDSGTHQKERSIWKQAGVEPKGTWYMEAGQGMGAVLQIADEKRAYTLTDRGTLLAYAQKLELAILYENEPTLYNPYGIIAVNPAVHRHVNYMGAMQLIAWFTSPEGQDIIGNFKKDGLALFVPMAVPMPASLKN